MFIDIRRSSPRENPAGIKARILTVSSYMPALKTWHMLLEAHGYQAVSFVLNDRLEDLFKHNQGPFDAIILGQSVDDAVKKKLVETLRQRWPAPIISVVSRAGEPIDGADIHTEPDPVELLNVIANLVQDQPRPATAD